MYDTTLGFFVNWLNFAGILAHALRNSGSICSGQPALKLRNIHSLRHFLKESDADDSDKMLQSRTVQYVLKYKKRQLEKSGVNLPANHKYANIEMNTMSQKLNGYRFTEMNYYEHQNVHDLEIVKAIVERRICSTKKIPNQRFLEMFEQYDEMVRELIDRSLRSDYDMVFSSLAFFTFEWHFPIETLYRIACIMEEKNLTEIDQSTIILLCGDVTIESQFGGTVSTYSRMVKERQNILDFLFDDGVSDSSKKWLMDLVKETIVLCVYYKECMADDNSELYKEWFRKESTLADWASFLRYYDLFSIWQKKEWTRKRIHCMRALFEKIIERKN